MGFFDSLFGGGGDQEVTTTNEPGPWPEGGKDFWQAFQDEFWGTPGHYEGGTSGSSALSGTYDELKNRLDWLNRIKAGDRTAGLYEKDGKIYASILPGDNRPGGGDADIESQSPIANIPGYDVNLVLPLVSGSQSLDDLISQYESQLAGTGGGTAGTTGTWVDATPGVKEMMLGQDADLREKQAAYQGAVDTQSGNLATSIKAAMANPIKFTYNGQNVGNAAMMGGVNLAKALHDANLEGPTTAWNYAQQNPKYNANLKYFDLLNSLAMGMQQLRYGTPTTTKEASGGGSLDSSIGGLLDMGLSAAKIWDIFA